MMLTMTNSQYKNACLIEPASAAIVSVCRTPWVIAWKQAASMSSPGISG